MPGRLSFMKNIICFFILILPLLVSGQSHNTTFGIRISNDIGLSVTQRIFRHTTLEGIVESKFTEENIGCTFLIKQHQRLLTRRFNAYMGAGYHQVFTERFKYEDQLPRGVTALAGAEITLGRLNIAWDFKVAYNYWHPEKELIGQTALSLRYVLIKRKMKKFKWKFWEK